ncbi:MAG: hypothetical protein ACTSU8_05665, partial [Alphaproteobacteria bacterium]
LSSLTILITILLKIITIRRKPAKKGSLRSSSFSTGGKKMHHEKKREFEKRLRLMGLSQEKAKFVVSLASRFFSEKEGSRERGGKPQEGKARENPGR